MTNNKGITLIALVITIIVLLILAGVSIAMLTGENVILTQSTRAKEDTSDAELADKINMALNGEFANLIADGYFSGAVIDDESGAITTPGEATAIASANGITGSADGSTGDFKIEVASDLTPDSAGAVLTITSTAKGTITGNIKYTPGADGADGKYTVNKAKYPGE